MRAATPQGGDAPSIQAAVSELTSLFETAGGDNVRGEAAAIIQRTIDRALADYSDDFLVCRALAAQPAPTASDRECADNVIKTCGDFIKSDGTPPYDEDEAAGIIARHVAVQTAAAYKKGLAQGALSSGSISDPERDYVIDGLREQTAADKATIAGLRGWLDIWEKVLRSALHPTMAMKFTDTVSLKDALHTNEKILGVLIGIDEQRAALSAPAGKERD